jgi:tetratricopeptide (TPR) repeat protein
MTDPFRTQTSRARAGGPDAGELDVERDAKIEELLLTGLDHYFAAEYEPAINVWTRALFLDRSHPRARAYIERARSALAERQRQSEELLQTGVAAFRRGDNDEARRLLTAALAAGAPTEDAQNVLDRLNQMAPAPVLPTQAASRRTRRAAAIRQPGAAAPRGFRFAAATVALVMIAVAGGFYIMANQRAHRGADTFDWRTLVGRQQARAVVAPPAVPRESVVPLPRRGEMALARARALAASGHLHDALSMLDAVRPTDVQKTEADRLRSDIQRQLLAVGAQTSRGGRAP